MFDHSPKSRIVGYSILNHTIDHLNTIVSNLLDLLVSQAVQLPRLRDYLLHSLEPLQKCRIRGGHIHQLTRVDS